MNSVCSTGMSVDMRICCWVSGTCCVLLDGCQYISARWKGSEGRRGPHSYQKQTRTSRVMSRRASSSSTATTRTTLTSTYQSFKIFLRPSQRAPTQSSFPMRECELKEIVSWLASTSGWGSDHSWAHVALSLRQEPFAANSLTITLRRACQSTLSHPCANLVLYEPLCH